MPVYSRDRIYKTDEGLREKDTGFRKEPFSQSFVRMPFAQLAEAIKLLYDHLIHEREYTGITDEDLKDIRRLESKLTTMLADDLQLRRCQDTILRCLHPDGYYHGFIKSPEFDRAYEISGTKRIEGIAGIRMGWPRAEIHELAEYLKTVIARIHRDYDSL